MRLFLLLALLCWKSEAKTSFLCADRWDFSSPICLPDDYDPSTPPELDKRTVKIRFRVRDLKFSRENEMKVTLDMISTWNEPRLLIRENFFGTREEVNPKILASLWIPEMTVLDAKSIEHPEIGGSSLEVTVNKSLILFRRTTITVRCWIGLRDFPFDEHDCYFNVGSFDDSQQLYETTDVTNEVPNTDLRFNVRLLNERESVYIHRWGNTTLAGFVVEAERILDKYVAFYFVPSAFIILSAWIMILWGNSFREKLGFLVFLAVLFLYLIDSVSKIIPCDEAGPNPIQIWMIIHTLFLFMAFLEVKISHWIFVRSTPKRLDENTGMASLPGQLKIDIIFFIMYPTMYAVIISLYFTFYLHY